MNFYTMTVLLPCFQSIFHLSREHIPESFSRAFFSIALSSETSNNDDIGGVGKSQPLLVAPNENSV